MRLFLWGAAKQLFVMECADKSGAWRLYEKVVNVPEKLLTTGIGLQIREANKVWVDEINIIPLKDELEE